MTKYTLYFCDRNGNYKKIYNDSFVNYESAQFFGTMYVETHKDDGIVNFVLKEGSPRPEVRVID